MKIDHASERHEPLRETQTPAHKAKSKVTEPETAECAENIIHVTRPDACRCSHTAFNGQTPRIRRSVRLRTKASAKHRTPAPLQMWHSQSGGDRRYAFG